MRPATYLLCICLPTLLVRPAVTLAQDSSNTRFIHSGTIEFERKENIRNEFQGEGDWADEYRKNMPENLVTYFDLSFADNISLFQPGRENPDNVRMWDAPGSNNIVYCDRNDDRQVSQKTIFGSTLLLSDSLRRSIWRVTPDTRVIAGFECHRATTVILDSIFVVAFYTDQIVPSGGPESFGGLPGMILGLVIPKLHTSWYATHLTLSESKPLVPPRKGTKMNYAEMQTQLNESLKDWGNYGKAYLLRVTL
jgi:GLPGLI family protein